MRRRPLTRLLAPVLTVLAVLLTVPGAASADEVADAKAQVESLGGEVARTTAELTAGTVRLEEGRARLAQTEAAAADARAAADEAAARAEAARAKLGAIVNAAYRTPRPGAVGLALGSAPGELGEAVRAEAGLEHVQGNQQDALRDATAEGVVAQDLSRRADALQADAEAQARDLEAQVAALTAQAQDMRARLDAATARLAAAQAAAAQQALVDASGGLALCTLTSPADVAAVAGYPNGFLPPESLCPLLSGGGHRLRADAAKAFNALYAAHPVCITDSYRSYGAQVDVFARKPDLAAVPGTSNHGLGLAVDLCGGIERFGSPEYLWMKANAPAYGFVHPAWAEPGGGRPEPWHWEYIAAQ